MSCFFFLRIRRPPRTTRTDTLFPYTTLFRSCQQKVKGQLHQAFPISSRTSVKRPVIAAAAAMAGDTRCVRAPGPCRPMKLRFDVDAQRSPLGNLSGFMTRQAEHDRKSTVEGQSGSVRVDLVGRGLLKKKNSQN